QGVMRQLKPKPDRLGQSDFSAAVFQGDDTRKLAEMESYPTASKFECLDFGCPLAVLELQSKPRLPATAPAQKPIQTKILRWRCPLPVPRRISARSHSARRTVACGLRQAD